MLKTLSQFILNKIWGWKIIGTIPDDLKKSILIVIPHTSNWDFPLGILVRTVIEKDIKFLAKSSLFKPLYGWLFKALGGYPVDRSKNNNMVDAVVDIFNNKEAFSIQIAPEGTRSKVDHLKTGFYYISLKAKVPLILTKFDYEHKQVVFSSPFYPTGNKEADFEFIYDYFRGVKGKHPEKSFLYDKN